MTVERNKQLGRALQILAALARTGTGATLHELAQSFGCNQRTIRRDLDALREAGFVLETDGVAEGRKRWRLHAKRSLQDVDYGHFLALRMAMGLGGPVRKDTDAFTALEALQDKIQKAIGPAGRKRLLAIDNCFHSYEKQAYRELPGEYLWGIVRAITERRLCRVTYRKPQAEPIDKRHEVLPLKVFSHQGAAYVMCHVPKHDAFITLNMQRIRGLQVLETRSPVPERFNAELMESAAFGVHTGAEPTRYALRFAPEVVAYIRERQWHPTQTLTDLDDGAVVLTFTCGRSWEVTAWVASWRHWVEVREPESLRAELLELGSTLLASYGPAPAKRTRREQA